MRYLVAPLAHVRLTFVPKSKTLHTVSGRRREISVRSSPRMYTMDHERTTLIERVSRYSEFSVSPIRNLPSAGKRTPRNPASGIPARVINAELDDAPEHREQRARLGSVY